MHFTYLQEESISVDLQQGDVLRKSDDLTGVLDSVHPYYSGNENNRYFIVLTQTCDLVRRGGDSCKAKYISVAPVRPLSAVIERFVNDRQDPILRGSIPVCSTRAKSQLAAFLERLFNNNETDYFYLYREPANGFAEDCCAFLRLPVALRSNEHYEKCLGARFLSLSEPFRAKLGWLVGQLFSRVGTQDWDQEALRNLIDSAASDVALWIDDKKLPQLKKMATQWRTNNPQSNLDQDAIGKLLDNIPSKKRQLIDRLGHLLRSSRKLQRLLEDGELNEKDVITILRAIENDATITTLLK